MGAYRNINARARSEMSRRALEEVASAGFTDKPAVMRRDFAAHSHD